MKNNFIVLFDFLIQTWNLAKFEFFCENFAWTYFRGQKNFKIFAKTNFGGLAKIPQNLRKLIYAKINPVKINLREN